MIHLEATHYETNEIEAEDSMNSAVRWATTLFVYSQLRSSIRITLKRQIKAGSVVHFAPAIYRRCHVADHSTPPAYNNTVVPTTAFRPSRCH